MITKEEYQLAYNLYTEGRILESTIASYELKALTESGEILEEGAAESIRNFVNKIIKGIQEAWNKFKGNVAKTKLKYTENEIKDAIERYEPHVAVENFIDYNPDIIKNLDIQTLDYNSMESSLDSVESFMERYYSSVYSDAKKSIYENIREKSIKSKSDKMEIKKEHLRSMFEYISQYDQFKNKLEEEIKKINSASQASDYIARMGARNESAEITSSTREEILAKTIKALEDQGLTPKITPRYKKKWVESGDSGEFGGSLCIAGLTKDVGKYTPAVNKIIKPLGATLTPDNYGTAFLSTKKSKPVSEVNTLESTMQYYFAEDSEPKPKVSSSEEEGDNKEQKKDDSVNKVQVYFKCVSQILSAQMKISREIYFFYNSVIDKHMINVAKNKVKEKVSGDKKNTSNNSNTTSQVKL